MTLRHFKSVTGLAAAMTVALLAGTMMIKSPRVQADSDNTDSRIQIGYNIAPVRLNTRGLNPALVGIGSYIVNAQADCNGCHNSPDLGGEWADGHNPYFGQPRMVNAKGYLGGGMQFGPFPGQGIGGVGPLMVYSRNLTPGCDSAPCANPLPEGGHTLQDFITILRTGHDFDLAHPACPTLGAEGCIASPPFAAGILQVMPWPVQGNMSDNDIAAIYEYLKAIPCISHTGTVGLPSNLYQACPAP
jgi:hypothetical protein